MRGSRSANAMRQHVAFAAGLTESQARLSQHLAARLVQQCPKQLPSPTLQKAAQLISESGADTAAPVADEVSRLCGADVAMKAPAPASAEEPDALEAVSRAQCTVQVSVACHLELPLHCCRAHIASVLLVWRCQSLSSISKVRQVLKRFRLLACFVCNV